MKKIFAICVVLMASFMAANAQSKIVAQPQDPAKHVARTFPMPVEHLYFHSEILDFDKNFTVLLPKSYTKEPDRKYPVAYILHGGGENDWEWANIPSQMINEAVTQVTNDGSAAEMILVFPNATEGKSGYGNREGWRYMDYFFQELVPYIESNYRVIADKGHRAVGGLSMGGGGTFDYAMTHPEMFSSAYVLSAHGVISAEEKDGLYGKWTLEQIEAAKSVNFVFDCGDDDIAFPNAIPCVQAMKKLGMTVQLRTYDGGHCTYYWYDGLRRALIYFTRHFSEQCK